MMVGTADKCGCLELFESLCLGVVLGTQAPFLGYDIPFLDEFIFRKQCVAHAVGFESETGLQPGFLKSLEIGRVV